MEKKVLYKIIVKGRVQGVGFRWGAAKKARDLGITGFVRNLPDGSVCLEAEGSAKELDAFIGWCREGPGFGFVESVKAELFPPAGYSEFRIEH